MMEDAMLEPSRITTADGRQGRRVPQKQRKINIPDGPRRTPTNLDNSRVRSQRGDIQLSVDRRLKSAT